MNNLSQQDFLSCDWGTTSFRLSFVSGAERQVSVDVREKAGVKTLHEQATGAGAKTQTERSHIFEQFLADRVQRLLSSMKLRGPVPLVISGMASSSVGWKELEYAKAPF